MEKPLFELREGVILYDVVNHDTSKNVTRQNLTDELALYHLRTNPDYIKHFTKYPDNWYELALTANGKAHEPQHVEVKAKPMPEAQGKRFMSAMKTLFSKITYRR